MPSYTRKARQYWLKGVFRLFKHCLTHCLAGYISRAFLCLQYTCCSNCNRLKALILLHFRKGYKLGYRKVTKKGYKICNLSANSGKLNKYKYYFSKTLYCIALQAININNCTKNTLHINGRFRYGVFVMQYALWCLMSLCSCRVKRCFVGIVDV